MEYVPSKEMLADGLTKALNPDGHEKFVTMCNLIDIKHLIEMRANQAREKEQAAKQAAVTEKKVRFAT